MRGANRIQALAVMAATLLATSCTNGGGNSTTSEPSSPTSLPARTTEVKPTDTAAADSSILPTAPPIGSASGCPLTKLDPSSEPISVSFWHPRSGQSGEVLQGLVDRFNSEQHGVHVDAAFQDVGEVGSYTSKLGTAEAPDVLMVPSGDTQRVVDTHSTISFGDCAAAANFDLSDLLPAVRALGMDGSKLQAMPWGQSGNVLYYDKADFAAAGLNPDDPPSTWAEVRADSRAIVAAGKAKHGISVTADASLLTVPFGLAGQAFLSAPDGGPRATHLEIDDPLAISTTTMLSEMVSTGEMIAFAPGPSPDALLAMATGDSSMVIAGGSGLRAVLNAIAGGVAPGLELGLAPVPVIDTPRSFDLEGAGNTIWLPDRSDTTKLTAAYTFVEWLNQPEQLFEWSSKTGAFPTRTSAARLPEMQAYWDANPLFRVSYDQVANHPFVLPSDKRRSGSQWAPIVEQAMTDILTKGANPSEVLATAGQKADKSLADYNVLADSGGAG